MQRYLRLINTVWLIVLIYWPFSWSIGFFLTDDMISNHFLWFYLKWSAYLYPGYYFISLFAGAKLAKESAPVWVKVFISLLPLLSFTPYTALFLLFAFSS